MRSITFLYFLSFVSAYAQERLAEISGRILQESLSDPLAYIHIELKDVKNNVVAETLSDKKGIFHLKNLPSGRYTLQASMSGFESYSQKIQLFDARIVLKDIFLKIKASDEVVKTADRTTITNKIDRKVVNIGKDLISAGSSAADVLNNVPSVSVDEQTGALSLRGQENATVLIDGKPSNIPIEQLLKQIPSDVIDKVELITSPSAKYNPEGTAGTLNIILKKSKQKGYHINLNSNMRSRKYPSHGTSLNANLNSGKFNFFSNYGHNKNHRQYKITGKRLDQDQLYEIFSSRTDESHLIKAGFDYFINEKNELTFSSTHNIQPYNESTRKSSTIYKDGTIKNNPGSTQIVEFHNQQYSLNSKHTFKKEDHYLTLDAIYSKANFWLKKDRRYQSISTNQQVQLDYTLPIVQEAKIETGLQYRQNKQNNDPNFALKPVDRFNFLRDIYSAYLTYTSKWNSLGLQLGLRGEQVQRNIVFLDNVSKEKKYFSLYPSAHLTYHPNEKDEFSLNYSRRVDRPEAGLLDPGEDSSRGNIILKGNPDLNPQYTHSIEWNYLHRFKKGDFTAGLFYRDTKEAIKRIHKISSNGNAGDPYALVMSWGNYGKEQSLGMELNGTYRWLSWWSFNGNLQFYRSYIRGFENLGAEKANQWSLNIRNEFKLFKNLSLQLFTLYHAPRKYLQGSSESFFKSALALRASLFEGKGDLNLRLSDVFNPLRFGSQIERPYREIIDFGPSGSPEISIGFSYNIGGKIRERKHKKVEKVFSETDL